MICGECGAKVTPLVTPRHVCPPVGNPLLHTITQDCKDRPHPPSLNIPSGWLYDKLGTCSWKYNGPANLWEGSNGVRLTDELAKAIAEDFRLGRYHTY